MAVLGQWRFHETNRSRSVRLRQLHTRMAIRKGGHFRLVSGRRFGARRHLWRAGAGGGEISGFFDGVSCGDDLDRARGKGADFAGDGGDCVAGGDGVNVFY
jgi:hypothetical protein